MTDAEINKIIEAVRPRNQQADLKRWLLPVVTGLVIGFVGWFANKSSTDIENTTSINKTLEFMQLNQTNTNEALKEQLDEMKETFEIAIEKINTKLDDQFTREDFNREMLYRDQDVKRMQNQVEEIFDKINDRK